MWFFKITEIASFESAEAKDPFLAKYLSLFSSMIFLILSLLCSAAVVMLKTCPFCLSSLGQCCGGGYPKSSDSTEVLV